MALLLCVALIVPSFLLVLSKDEESETKGDAAVAADISNMTGVKTELILNLRQAGLSWNEVLESLEKKGKDNKSAKNDRSELLAGVGIEETIVKLQEEGFVDEDMMEAKMIAERLQFQLQELTDDQAKGPEQPAVLTVAGEEEKKKDAKIEAIRKLSGQFDLGMAVYGMVKLKQSFGSFEAALDEYLLALQLGIRFEQYFEDKEAYLKEKEEKSASLTHDEIITITVVELTMLENVQQNNRQAAEDDRKTPQAEIMASELSSSSKGEMSLHDIPLPQVAEVKPENPAMQVMKEIESLNPNKP